MSTTVLAKQSSSLPVFDPYLVAKKKVDGLWRVETFSNKGDAEGRYSQWYTDDDYDTLLFAKLLRKHVR